MPILALVFLGLMALLSPLFGQQPYNGLGYMEIKVDSEFRRPASDGVGGFCGIADSRHLNRWTPAGKLINLIEVNQGGTLTPSSSLPEKFGVKDVEKKTISCKGDVPFYLAYPLSKSNNFQNAQIFLGKSVLLANGQTYHNEEENRLFVDSSFVESRFRQVVYTLYEARPGWAMAEAIELKNGKWQKVWAAENLPPVGYLWDGCASTDSYWEPLTDEAAGDKVKRGVLTHVSNSRTVTTVLENAGKISLDCHPSGVAVAYVRGGELRVAKFLDSDPTRETPLHAGLAAGLAVTQIKQVAVTDDETIFFVGTVPEKGDVVFVVRPGGSAEVFKTPQDNPAGDPGRIVASGNSILLEVIPRGFGTTVPSAWVFYKPTITVRSVRVVAGNSLEIEGLAFSPSQTATVKMSSSILPCEISQGRAVCRIPEWMPAGKHPVQVLFRQTSGIELPSNTVDITVLEPPRPTVFSAKAAGPQIDCGQSAGIVWEANMDAKEVSIVSEPNDGGVFVSTGFYSRSGRFVVTPKVTTTYTITLQNREGEKISVTATVVVARPRVEAAVLVGGGWLTLYGASFAHKEVSASPQEDGSFPLELAEVKVTTANGDVLPLGYVSHSQVNLVWPFGSGEAWLRVERGEALSDWFRVEIP